MNLAPNSKVKTIAYSRIRVSTCGHIYSVDVPVNMHKEDVVAKLDRILARPCAECRSDSRSK